MTFTRTSVRTSLPALLAVLAAASAACAGAWRDFPLHVSEQDQRNPDISGGTVVWQQLVEGDWDIFGYNLTTNREFAITDNEYDQVNPAISGNTVVWQDNRSGAWNIYAAKLGGPEAGICSSPVSGDLDGDCKVNLGDFSIMSDNWLRCNFDFENDCF
jgi:beta propeller repeat protein